VRTSNPTDFPQFLLLLMLEVVEMTIQCFNGFSGYLGDANCGGYLLGVLFHQICCHGLSHCIKD
jgi:hypothetical protein